MFTHCRDLMFGSECLVELSSMSSCIADTQLSLSAADDAFWTAANKRDSGDAIGNSYTFSKCE